MARPRITREQVFEAADALLREGHHPTVVRVRTRLGGGSPNTLAPLLAEWKSLHEQAQAVDLPSVPESVEAVLRQVWAVAWQQAQGQLTGERDALALARQEVERERLEMLTEIGRLDKELDAARETLRQEVEVLEQERRAHAETRNVAREASVLASEREKRIQALEAESAREQQARADLEATLMALRVEVATLSERSAHIEDLRSIIRDFKSS